MTREFVPSVQQLEIADFCTTSPSRGNLLVEAVAGSGKTTTLVWLLSQIPTRSCGSNLLPDSFTFLAFNKSIADTLRERCPKHVSCSTFHSLGFRALKSSGLISYSCKVEGRKVPKLVWNRTDRDDPDVPAIIKLVSLAKSQNPADEIDWKELAARFDLDFAEPKKAFGVAANVLHASDQDLSTIDFDDMLRLPVLHNVHFDQQDWVFVDESQDTNDIQIEILSRLVKHEVRQQENGFGKSSVPSTRFIFVGDSHQAIYGFRGANSDAMHKIARRFACEHLPLSVSYRCPKKVVAEAQKYLKQAIT